MITDFEPIYAALFTLLQGTSGVVTASREWVHYTEAAKSPELQPAIYMTELTESASNNGKLPSKWVLQCEVWVYVHQASVSVLKVTAMNSILRALREVLMPDYPSEQTLGGLCHQCRIKGDVEKDAGALGPQSLSYFVVEILVP